MEWLLGDPGQSVHPETSESVFWPDEHKYTCFSGLNRVFRHHMSWVPKGTFSIESDPGVVCVVNVIPVIVCLSCCFRSHCVPTFWLGCWLAMYVSYYYIILYSYIILVVVGRQFVLLCMFMLIVCIVVLLMIACQSFFGGWLQATDCFYLITSLQDKCMMIYAIFKHGFI